VTAGGWEQSQPPNSYLDLSEYLARYFTGEEAGGEANGR